MQDITPQYPIIPLKDKLVFPQQDEFGSKVGGLGGTLASVVADTINNEGEVSGDVTGTVGGVSAGNIAIVANDNANAVPIGLSISSTGIATATDGTQSAYVILTWTANAESTFDHYLIRYKKHAYTYYTQLTANTNTITIDGLVPNTAYDFGTSTVNKYGISSAFCADVAQTTASDTAAPATVTAGSATGGIQYVILEWTHNTETDLASYNVYRSETNNSATGVLIGNCRTNYFVDGNRVGGTTYYYWVKAVDTSGNVSAAFSTVKSAAPRNVTSDDIVTIAGSKVLIDGTVYLSNWRHGSDLTKIDGGDIYANSVTLTQLNFTPVQSTDVIAKINASAEGITIDADNLTINAATTFGAGYNPTGRVLAVGGTYDSAASGARVRIFPDANTGIQVIDDGAADVFKCIVGGTNVGDVQIGNYASGQGALYDKSAGLFNFKGTIVAGTVFVGTDASLLKMAAISDFPPDTNLVGYWSFDEGAGTNIADSSGNNNPGISSDTTVVAGVSGNGRDFNGTTSKITVAHNSTLNLTTAGTISFWARIDNKTDFQRIIGKQANWGTPNNYFVGVYNNNLYFDLSAGGSRYTAIVSITSLTSAFHHFACVYDGANLLIYIDGVQSGITAAASLTMTTNTEDLIIGGSTANNVFDGLLDEVRIYSSALTAKQIYALYKNPQGGKSFNVPVGSLISGSIYSKQITLAVTPGLGSTYIRAGKTSFDPVTGGNGFILGIDDDDSDKAKFIIGNDTEYLAVLGNTFVNKLKIMPYTASVGGATIKSTTTARNISSTTYTEVKRITVGRRGNYKLFYEILTYMSSPYHGYGQVKLNGSVIASVSASAPSDISDTITVNSLVPGDVLSLFIKYEAGSDGPVGSRGFDLKVDVADEVYAPFYSSGLD